MGDSLKTRNPALRRWSLVSALALGASWTGHAHAQELEADSLNQAFAEGFELNPIEPAPAGDRFFVVPGGFSDPDAPKNGGPVRGMLLLHYTHSPSLVRTDAETGEVGEIVQSQLYAHANVTGYLLPWLMVNADLPFAVLQKGEGDAAPSTALGDLRVGARFGLFGKRSSAFSISPGLDLWIPTGSPANLTGDEGMRGEPYVSVGGQAGAFVYAAKAGVQIRKPVYTGSLEVGSSFTYGVAAGLSLFRNQFQIGPELAGRSLLGTETEPADNFSGPTSPMTGGLGARLQLGDFNLGAAFGLGLTEAPGNAPRTMLSFSYNPIKVPPKPKKVELPPEKEPEPKTNFVEEPSSPAASSLDSDGDGIEDSVDSCPQQKGVSSASLEMHGCPEKELPPAAEPKPEAKPKPLPPPRPVDPSHDTDGDGIADWEDSCLYTKGLRRTDNDSRNGCPPDAPQSKKKTDTKPSSAATPPASASSPPRTKKKGPPTATWVGFRELSETSSLLYVTLTKEVTITKKTTGKTVTYTMSGTRVRIKNNRNPLLTTHFGSVVKAARLKPAGKNLRLEIELKTPAKVTHKLVNEGPGSVLRVQVEAQKK